MQTHNLFKVMGWIAALLLVIQTPAFAHTDASGITEGFISGFTHPLLGWDHIATMVAVGLWCALLGRPAVWILPVAFPLMMAIGGILGLLNVGIPAVEAGIAVSSIVLGLLIVLAIKTPIGVAVLLVGIFAIFHGHAHGTELPDTTNALSFSLGFVSATALLHAAGIVFGKVTHLPYGEVLVRISGGLITLVGVGFLTGTL